MSDETDYTDSARKAAGDWVEAVVFMDDEEARAEVRQIIIDDMARHA